MQNRLNPLMRGSLSSRWRGWTDQELDYRGKRRCTCTKRGTRTCTPVPTKREQNRTIGRSLPAYPLPVLLRESSVKRRDAHASRKKTTHACNMAGRTTGEVWEIVRVTSGWTSDDENVFSPWFPRLNAWTGLNTLETLSSCVDMWRVISLCWVNITKILKSFLRRTRFRNLRHEYFTQYHNFKIQLFEMWCHKSLVKNVRDGPERRGRNGFSSQRRYELLTVYLSSEIAIDIWLNQC